MKSICLLFLLSFGVSVSVTADSKEYNYVSQQLVEREADFERFLSEKVAPFWQTDVNKSEFVNRQNLQIHYAYSLVPEAKKAVVFSPGRGEGYAKYKELLYDFTQQGYSVFIIDHQGQGLSSRRLDNRHKGYVEEFNDYVVDLNQFVQDVVKVHHQGELMLVSHSMGGAIGLRYLQQYPEVFSKTVFSSPMWGLNAGAMPKPIAKGLFNFVNWLTTLVTDQNPYFLGSEDYSPTPFSENQLTSSKVRYQQFRHEYDSNPDLQIGGVTFGWIRSSINAIDTAFDKLYLVKSPVMVLQSGNDEVIDNQAQNAFCKQLALLGNPCVNQVPIVIEGAKHELFIESDPMRAEVLEKVFTFLDDK